MVEADWTLLAEQCVYARPATDEDARDALEWIAARRGKTLVQLVEELHERAAPQAQGATP
jgi:hypothetical protein